MTLAVDGTPISVSASNITISTASTNDIILFYSINQNGSNVTSLSSTSGLMWNVRTQQTALGIFTDLWWAYAPNILTNEVITPSYSSGSGPRLAAIGVNGANTTTPFDANSSFPAFTSGIGSPLSVTCSTNNANTMLFGFLRVMGAVGTVTRPSGFNSLVSAGADSDISNSLLSSTISGVSETISWTGASANADWLIDAVQAASASFNPAWATNSNLINGKRV